MRLLKAWFSGCATSIRFFAGFLIGSVCAPDQAILKAKNHALQCTTAGPYNAIYLLSFLELALYVVLGLTWRVFTPSALRPAIELPHARPRIAKALGKSKQLAGTIAL